MRITSKNLDETVELNLKIERQVKEHIAYIDKRLIKWRSLPLEEQAYEILKEYNLIELPIPDENWGGAIRKFSSGLTVPVINTAQPRLYQYFIYWHEVYHLTEHEEIGIHPEDYEITIEFDLNERKADYFASQMIFGRHDLYDYYLSLRHDDFLVNVAHCMKSFKAPYKAVLIQLYQIAKKSHNDPLQEQIRLYFDKHWSTDEWAAIFQDYSLDDSLMKPSLIINLHPIMVAIREQIEAHPDVELYQDNLRVVEKWATKYSAVQKELKEHWNG